MKKTIIALVLLATVIGCQATGNTETPTLIAAPAEDSVTICHCVSVRGSKQCQTLRIPTSYLNVHLAHGDAVGTCQ